MQPFRIETERLELREMRMSDLFSLFHMFDDPEHMRYYPRTFTLEEARNWIRWNLRNYRQFGHGLWLMELKDSGDFVGNCGLTKQLVEHEQFVEVGWHTKRSAWGKGFAAEAGAACRDYAFASVGVDRLISLIRPENEQSARVAQKIGLTVWREVMRVGGLHHVYSMTRSQWNALTTVNFES
jgi:[ribosomal protein S5]-alanine N-acetyltransferase